MDMAASGMERYHEGEVDAEHSSPESPAPEPDADELIQDQVPDGEHQRTEHSEDNDIGHDDPSEPMEPLDWGEFEIECSKKMKEAEEGEARLRQQFNYLIDVATSGEIAKLVDQLL